MSATGGASGAPVLLIDVGGTLLTRTRPGLATRVAVAIAAAGETVSRAAVGTAVLTSPDPEAVQRGLPLRDPTTRAAVAAALAEDPGEAVVLPGAEHLLTTARELGWDVVVTSNAGPGTPPLPDVLGRHLTGVVESRAVGLVKEDPRFWTRLIECDGVDPHSALVVGDDPEADRDAPATAGLQSRLVREGTLASLAADLRTAGRRPHGATAVVAGDHEQWAGRDTVPAPHLAGLVTRVTRARLRFVSGDAAGAAIVVRRRTRAPAVVRDGEPLPGVAWLLAGRERPEYTVPAALARELDERGLSLDGLPSADRKHALSMIREARTTGTTAARMSDLIRFLTERGSERREDGGHP